MGNDLDRAPEAIARAVALRDPQLAELLSAQCERIRHDTSENRTRERELVRRAGPHQPAYRAQFRIRAAGLFSDNLTCLDDGGRSYVWLYDDDIVSLSDRHPDGDDPWAHNLAARARLTELCGSWRAQLVSSIRLCLFGGTAEIADTARGLGVADRVTHMDLRTQRELATHPPIARSFPSLRGLVCDGFEAASLLAEQPFELRALIIRRAGFEAALEHATAASRLEYLGIHHTPTTEADLASLATHPLLERLIGLEIFSVNHATQFPFDTLLGHRAAFARLRRLAVAGHLVPADVRARFEDWPEVEFISHDRRETMALDFETGGWAGGAR